jgi:uncharacterized protein
MSFSRLYPKITGNAFLFGPRGVGKSTFVKDQLKPDFTIDLLETRQFFELKRDPGLLEAKIGHLSKGDIVFIDEIQKIPALLNEVHRLIEKKKLIFLMSGSSARKLKRGGANLLGGRAITRKMFPFSIQELQKKFPITRLLETGTLPVVLKEIESAEDTLSSYVDTYLKEEIKEEAITRSLEDFARFFEIAAQLNGRVLNFENVGKETGKSGDTIKKWYSILEETFIGSYIFPYRPGFKVREVSHPKFYFFDPGVSRAAAGLIREPLDVLSKGYALETLVLNELKIYNEVSKKDRKISFYSIPGQSEIDFIIEVEKKTIDRPGKFISIECKTSSVWKKEFETASRTLQSGAKGRHLMGYGVYLGREERSHDGFHALPIDTFVEKLHSGKLF